MNDEEKNGVLNKNNLWWILVLLICVFAIVICFLQYKNSVLTQQTQALQKQILFQEKEVSNLKNYPLSAEEMLKMERERRTSYFISDILPNNASASSLFTNPNDIQAVYALPTSKWIIITHNQNGYLLAGESLVDLELDSNSLPCTLGNLSYVSVVPSLNLGVPANDRRFVITGECAGYGVSEFTGLYNFETGKQIRFFGESPIPGRLLSVGNGFAAGAIVPPGSGDSHNVLVRYPRLGLNGAWMLFDGKTGKVVDTLVYE